MVTSPLYVRVLGPSWTLVAEPVRYAHATTSVTRAHGSLRIAHGGHRLAGIVARVLRLPPPSAAATTQLTVRAHGGREEWRRMFAGASLVTEQYQASACELAERFGIVEFRFGLEVADGCLVYHQHGAALVLGGWRVPLPASLAPRVEARESPDAGDRVRVSVSVQVPGIGQLIAYDGTIEVERPRA